jgi:iron complex outermembrane receptor protein
MSGWRGGWIAAGTVLAGLACGSVAAAGSADAADAGAAPGAADAAGVAGSGDRADAAAGVERAGAEAPQAGAGAGLGTVVVTATRSPAEALGVPASVSVVDEPTLRERRSARFGDAISELPGVYLQGVALGGAAFPASGQAALSLRGIPRTPRTLVMIDGQPINNALSGGINVAGIPLEALGRLEVVRGPYSALYGGAAMGGVVHFVSASPDAPLSEVRLGAGTLGQRGAALVHRTRLAGGLGLSLAAGWREGDGQPDGDYVVKQPSAGAGGVPVTGARPTTTPAGVPAWWVGLKGARPWSQDGGQLTLDFAPAPSTRLSGGVGWARYEVGYRPYETFLADGAGRAVVAGPVRVGPAPADRLALAETDFVTATPSGERDLRGFARLDHRFADGTRLAASVGTLRDAFTFTMPLAGVAGYDSGPGELTEQPNRRIDADVSLRRAMSDTWVLIGGVARSDLSLDRTTTRLSSWRDYGSGLSVLSASSGTSRNDAIYLQSEHDLGAGLTAYVGARYDRFRTEGRVAQFSPPAFDLAYPQRTFDQTSPKLALVWRADPRLALRASWGAAFRPPSLLEMYSRTVVPTAIAGVVSVTEPAPDLQPERVRAFEVGADVAVPGGGTGSVTLYRQRLTDLIYRSRVSPTLTRTVNAGEASVDGVEASVSWPIGGPGLVAYGSLTHQFRYDVTRNDAVPASVGKRLTDVPRTTGAIGLTWRAAPWSALVSYRYVSQVFGSGDDLNLNVVEGVFGAYDAYGVVRARLAWQAAARLELALTLDNLTDRRYFSFYAQPGRTAYLEAAWRF